MSPSAGERIDDAAVIERSLRAGEAFAELYDRHAAAIFRFIARRLGDQAAEDVLAETFLAAFRRRERYDLSRRDARPWLYGIAVNVIGKHRRAEVRMLRALARQWIYGAFVARSIGQATQRDEAWTRFDGRQGDSQQLLLDPRTYKVNGLRTISNGTWPVNVMAKNGPSYPRGTVIESDAWVKVALVSGPGER